MPGELHGLWTEYTHFGGQIDWKSLVEPTIKLMEEGDFFRLLENKSKLIFKEKSLH